MRKYIEIERRFLVENFDTSIVAEAMKKETVVQGYLQVDPEKTQRVRIVSSGGGTTAYLTVKGKRVNGACAELEAKIPSSMAIPLLTKFRVGELISKTRYTLAADDLQVWVIDVFKNKLKGLVIAEIELEEDGQDIVIPSWAGKEITEDHRYSNSALAMTSAIPE